MVTGTVNPATFHGTNVSLYFIQATGWNGGMVTVQGNYYYYYYYQYQFCQKTRVAQKASLYEGLVTYIHTYTDVNTTQKQNYTN